MPKVKFTMMGFKDGKCSGSLGQITFVINFTDLRIRKHNNFYTLVIDGERFSRVIGDSIRVLNYDEGKRNE